MIKGACAAALGRCARCGLAATRRQVVVGRGSLPAQLLFIGEAPGKSEDVLGEAFVGAPGKLFDLMRADAGLAGVSFFATNIVLCRPCDSRGGDNRDPSPGEVLACASNVQTLIEACRPKAVVLFGQVAAKYLGKDFPYAKRCIHPSALQRGGGRASPFYFNTIRQLEAIKHELES